MTASDDELRMLRERAYGPGADIHEDPEALARLRELEAPMTVSEPVADETANDPDAAAPASVELREAEDGETPEDADPPTEASAPPRRRLSRRVTWLWAASVAVALIVGAAVTMATSSLGAGRVAVLAEAELSDWPTDAFGDPQEGSRVFESFHGMRVLLVPNAWGNPEAGVSCIFIAVEREMNPDLPASEILTTGCGDAGFPPTASFTVTERSPEGLRESFPVGTAMRIVLEGDGAHVFARAGAPLPTP